MTEEFDAFMELFKDLPREGPGNVDSLLSVLDMAATPPDARIFDAACGSGADSELFARALPNAEILAVDKQAQFIEAAQARGIRASFKVGDMLEPDGKFDLIWSAGAVYFCGVEKALETWRKHLKPGGKIAFSEVVWLTDEPSTQAKEYWEEAYPHMVGIHQMIGRIEALGFRVISATPLGRPSWEAFYDPIKKRAEQLRGQGPVMDAVLAENDAEVAMFEACFGEYDYVVYLVEPA